jgi:hypothetical protein
MTVTVDEIIDNPNNQWMTQGFLQSKTFCIGELLLITDGIHTFETYSDATSISIVFPSCFKHMMETTMPNQIFFIFL